ACRGTPPSSAARTARLRNLIAPPRGMALAVEPHFRAGIEIAAVVAERRRSSPREDTEVVVVILGGIHAVDNRERLGLIGIGVEQVPHAERQIDAGEAIPDLCVEQSLGPVAVA